MMACRLVRWGSSVYDQKNALLSELCAACCGLMGLQGCTVAVTTEDRMASTRSNSIDL